MMHPDPRHRTFEGAGSGDPLPQALDGPDLPVEGHAVLLDRALLCPHTDRCGGHLHVHAVLWVDAWPITAPEVDQPGARVEEYPEKTARTLHLSISRQGLEETTGCTAGCVLSDREWQDANNAAFLSLCAAYTEEVHRLRVAVDREDGDPGAH